MDRIASIKRKTNETDISIEINLDGTGISDFKTGVPILEHMLEQISLHGMIDLHIQAEGDLHIDAHHTVEDIGIALGQAIHKALGDMKGISRFGNVYVPVDESLSRVVIDISGRPHLDMNVDFTRQSVGDLDTELFYEFFTGFVNHANITLHIDNLKGRNAHHQIESIYKAFGKSLKMATSIEQVNIHRVPSTKGIL